MSEIIEVVQKQDPGSELVVLFDLEYADGSFAYFTSSYDSGSVQFRDASNTINTYESLPIQADGFDISSEGSYSRPTLTVGNVSSVFADAIGIDFEDLIGRRVTRRITMKKYLVGESGDTFPAVEYPKTTYIIDRIMDRSIISVSFELAAPFDLISVQLPRRQVLGGGCPWKYTGASPNLNEEDKLGGCIWHNQGAYKDEYVYVSKKDEYIIDQANTTINTFTSGSTSATANNYYSFADSSPNFKRYDTDGNFDSGFSSITGYWQCVSDTSDDPSDTNVSWRRVRVWNDYSAASTYYAYSDPEFNEYVKYSNEIYKVKTISVSGTTPVIGNYWTYGDVCGKRVTSCSRRFHAIPDGNTGATVPTDKAVSLPFGGFPASRAFK
jgi:lambda family phage minor tail protein L